MKLMKYGFSIFLASLMLLGMFAFGAGANDSKSEFIPVTGIEYGPSGRTVELGQARVIPSNATNQTITWTYRKTGSVYVETSYINPYTGNLRQTIAGKGTLTYIARVKDGVEVGVDYKEEFVLNIDTTPTITIQMWWEDLPGWAQWILRYLFFGWLWMK